MKSDGQERIQRRRASLGPPIPETRRWTREQKGPNMSISRRLLALVAVLAIVLPAMYQR